MYLARLMMVLTIGVGSVALGVAYATGLGGVTASDVGAEGADVNAPPVSVTNWDWVTHFEGGEYRIQKVNVDVSTTDASSPELLIRMTLTQGGVLKGFRNIITTVSGTPQSETFNFDSQNIRAEDIDDVHLLICDSTIFAGGACEPP